MEAGTVEFLDTSNPHLIEQYKNNLNFLINEANQKGKIDRFALIREDDYLPEDWKWRSNSMYTQMEYSTCFLNGPLIEALCMIKVREKRKSENKDKQRKTFFSKHFSTKRENFQAPIVPTVEEEKAAYEEIDKTTGQVLLPVRYRVTKHFTINTPLSHTGEYNTVSIHRNFIVIDDAKLFFESPYVFTASYVDSYLDTTHEPLPISNRAIVMIPEDRYSQVMKENGKCLAERKVIVFKGDEGLAVNMVLARNGYFPARFGWNYADYDPKLLDIIEKSMIEKCRELKIPYKIPHNNHFSDKLSDNNSEFQIENEKLYIFLQDKFPQCASIIPKMPLEYKSLEIMENNRKCAERLIEKVGTDALIKVIQEYNELQKQYLEEKIKMYRSIKVDVEQLSYYRKIAALVRENSVSQNFTPDIYSSLQKFYEMGNTKEQYVAAQELEKEFEKETTSFKK